MCFEERAGLVDVTVVHAAEAVTGAAITAPRPLEVGQAVAVDLVAACASLTREDVVIDTHPPRIVSVGLPFVVAELASRAALAQARPNLTSFVQADAAVPLADGRFSLFLASEKDRQRHEHRIGERLQQCQGHGGVVTAGSPGQIDHVR